MSYSVDGMTNRVAVTSLKYRKLESWAVVRRSGKACLTERARVVKNETYQNSEEQQEVQGPKGTLKGKLYKATAHQSEGIQGVHRLTHTPTSHLETV